MRDIGTHTALSCRQSPLKAEWVTCDQERDPRLANVCNINQVGKLLVENPFVALFVMGQSGED